MYWETILNYCAFGGIARKAANTAAFVSPNDSRSTRWPDTGSNKVNLPSVREINVRLGDPEAQVPYLREMRDLYKGQASLVLRPGSVEEVSAILALANQHRIPVNLQPFGLDNPNVIFVTTSEPFGLIKGTIERDPPR